LSDTLTVEKELEADCMAGAFLAWEVDKGNLTEDNFFDLLNLVNDLGDPDGTSAADPRAHGMGSQRVAMVLRGYYNGTGSCGTF
jgi:predicted metalloprotease